MSASSAARGRWARLAQMSWDELRTRGSQALAKRWDLARYRLGLRPAGTASARRQTAAAGRFFFATEDVPALAKLLRERLPQQAEEIVRQAERICRHRFDLLGYTDLDYGSEIDWHLDAVNGKRAPRKPWFEVRYLDFDEVGDAKVTWELNRHQHLVTLAKAYCLSRDERLVAELMSQWSHWQEQNPYPIGIPWASSLEVGFRSLSWLWVRHLLAGSAALPPGFQADLAEALALHGHHIERYLSTYFSPNTHLLGEGVALFFLGVLCPELPRAARWRERGWRIVLEEARRQVRPDGMHFEQSTYYHVYALDFFLHARLLAAANRIPVPEEFDRRLEKMLEVLCVLGRAGAVPRFGDDDGGRVFDPRRCLAEHLLDPLATGAALLGRADFKTVAGGLREETLWLLGPNGVENFDRLPASAPAGESVGFVSSGIYVLAASEPARQQLVLDAGPLGAGRGGHAHADALSLQLVVNGREWLGDPGTGVYVSSENERDLFRGTAAHNTLQVDSASQAEPAGPFAWSGQPEVRVERWVAGKTFDLLSAQHHGFERLGGRVVHRRRLFHVKHFFWLVEDRVTGTGEHDLEVFWHVAPGLNCLGKSGTAALLSAADQQALALLTVESQGWSREVAEGWWSPAYGKKEPSPVLRFRKRASLPVEFATLLVPGAEKLAELGELEQLREAANPSAPTGYCYRAAQESHWMLFAEPGMRWELGRFSSDAEFLYCRTSAAGELRQLVVCAGSSVEFAGHRVLAARKPVARCEWVKEGATAHVFCSEDGALSLWPGKPAAEAEAVLAGEPGPKPRRGAS